MSGMRIQSPSCSTGLRGPSGKVLPLPTLTVAHWALGDWESPGGMHVEEHTLHLVSRQSDGDEWFCVLTVHMLSYFSK